MKQINQKWKTDLLMPVTDLHNTDIALCFGLNSVWALLFPQTPRHPIPQQDGGLCSRLALGEFLGRPKDNALSNLQHVCQCVFRNLARLTPSRTRFP